jgi:hypothetical protein
MLQAVRRAMRTSRLALALFLGACATPAPVDMTFGASSVEAMAVIAAPSTIFKSTTYFRQVDVANGVFGKETFDITSATIGGNQVNANLSDSVWISFRKLPPGDYAIVALATNTGNAIAYRCMDAGAPVFTLKPGQISLVRIDPYWASAPTAIGRAEITDEQVMQVFMKVRDPYWQIVGDGVIVPPATVIRWPKVDPGILGGTCKEPATFSPQPVR